MLSASVNPSWDLGIGGGGDPCDHNGPRSLDDGEGGGGRGKWHPGDLRQTTKACALEPGPTGAVRHAGQLRIPRRKQPRVATQPAGAFALAPGFPAAAQLGWELSGFS